MNWISIEDRLPPFDKVVLVHTQSRSIMFGGRFHDGDGWDWGALAMNVVLDNDDWNDLEYEDDLEITHWAELTRP